MENFHLENSDNFYPNYYELFEDYIKSINILCKFILHGQDENYISEIKKSHEDALNSGNMLLTLL